MAGNELDVTVSDTGAGVPPEDRERIFESFQQGARGAPKEEGTGLGLTLCRRIVELFGGRLWLDSEVGSGSTFGFAIPLRTLAGEVESTPHADLGGAAVLIVDDDRASLELMTAYLSGLATRVIRAHDGVEALEQVRRHQPSAVVLDIRLPKKDGWDVLAELKADSSTAHIPVVVASIVDDRSRGLALGAAAYLLKPVRRDQLVDALRRVGALTATGPGSEVP